MTNADAIKWLENLKKDIGNPAHQSLWHYEQALTEIIDLLTDRKTEPNDYCKRCTNKGDHDGECSNCVSDSEVIKWKMPSHYKPKDEPNCSEKPNNCETCRHYTLTCDLFSEICKYEPKDEPQTSGVVWTDNEMPIYHSTTASTDEPQTDCKTCKHKDLEGCEEPCLECKGYDLYESQDKS